MHIGLCRLLSYSGSRDQMIREWFYRLLAYNVDNYLSVKVGQKLNVLEANARLRVGVSRVSGFSCNRKKNW